MSWPHGFPDDETNTSMSLLACIIFILVIFFCVVLSG